MNNKRNLAYFVIALLTTAGAGIVWSQYFSADELGLTNNERLKLESNFVLSTETEYDRFKVAMDSQSIDQLSVGNSTEVDILFESEHMEEVSGAQIVLSYDPKVVKVSAIRNGDMFEYYLQREVDKESGRVSISGATPVENFADLSDFRFATLRIERLTEGEANFRTFGVEDQENENIISRVSLVDFDGAMPIAAQQF